MASTRISIIRCATMAELVAGLLTTGIPARSAAAAFSAMPQAGKLKALMWIATPVRLTCTCWPWKRGLRPRVTPSPSTSTLRRPDRLADVRVGGEGEDRAVHVELRVAAGVAAVGHREVEQLVAVRLQRVGGGAERGAPLGEGQRAQRGAAHRARVVQHRRHVHPARPARASGSSVAGFTRVARSPVPAIQRPAA